jgi:hypothetical protein
MKWSNGEKQGIIFQKGKPKFIQPASVSRWKETQMKDNSKKLTVFVIIAALAVFMVVATASARGLHPIHNAIKGQYAATGSSQCTSAVEGFEAGLLTPKGNYWSVGTSTFIAIYTFNRDGSGSMEGINRIMSLPGGFTPSPTPGGADVPNDKPMGVVMDPYSYEFTYTVTDEGLITFTVVPGTFQLGGGACADRIAKHGVISGDGKTIVIECGPPLVLNVVLCSDPDQEPIGPQMMCVNSAVLIKIQGSGELPPE